MSRSSRSNRLAEWLTEESRFSGVIAGSQATPDQIEFIELIVAELTAAGVMEAGRLYESPFLDISPQGPEGLFPAAKVERMVQVLEEIRQRAVA